jgi:hypothetical protein
MASPLFPDPLQMWRDALSKLENDVNSMATGSLRSQDVMRAVHQFSNVSMGMEQMLEKALDAYLKRANLPSRKEVAALADALQRIEEKIDRLLPAEEATAAPRPSRTRKPPAPPEAAAPAPAAAPAAAAPAKKRRRAKA